MKTLTSLMLLLALAVTARAAPPTPMPEQPALSVTTLDGTVWELDDHRGHWVVVNFWATWCAPCIKEMPEISGFVKAHDNVQAIGLAFEDADKAAISTFLARHPVVYPVAKVDPFRPPPDFDTPRGLPTTYVIDPQGRVAKKFVGPITASDLRKVIGAKPAS